MPISESARALRKSVRHLGNAGLFLHPDPFEQTTGIEFAKGQGGEDFPYVQVSAEPLTDAPVYDPVANIVKIEHRAETSSEFTEIMGETQIAGWSRQPPNLRLSKGKPIRFNICWYDDSGVHDAFPMSSYKLAQAYAKLGKSGEYRYKVHVDGRDVVRTEAFVCVRWRVRGHPVITMGPISPLAST